MCTVCVCLYGIVVVRSWSNDLILASSDGQRPYELATDGQTKDAVTPVSNEDSEDEEDPFLQVRSGR